MTPESKIKDQVKEFLNSLGPDCWYYCPVPMGYGRKGIPDFIGCYKGYFFSVETKTKTGKVTPWQMRELGKIAAAQGMAWAFDPDFGFIQWKEAFCKYFKVNFSDAL